jgi:NAD(P)-dependent dehydrogenase (short-subunit alcohol dehydrogenase family)
MSTSLLQDRVCIVSGAGPGVGRATALAFAREGAKLVLAGRSDASTGALAAELETMGTKVAVVKADIAKAEDRTRLVERAVNAFGGIDVLVCNAFATGRPGPLATADLAKAWHAPFEVNLFGTMALAQAVVPQLAARGGGSIVMIGTLAAHKPVAGMSGYGASKAALEAASRSLALEVGRQKIRVNTVVPGHIDGPNLRVHFQMEAKRLRIPEEDVYQRIAAEGVLGHIATSEEVAEAVLFLASPRAAAITGQSLHVNAGQYFA